MFKKLSRLCSTNFSAIASAASRKRNLNEANEPIMRTQFSSNTPLLEISICKLKNDQGDCQICHLHYPKNHVQDVRKHYETNDNQHREKMLRILFMQDYIEQ